MMNKTYELHVSGFGIGLVATDSEGKTYGIPFDEANSDYQQYLVDTDGGLPLPKETEGDK